MNSNSPLTEAVLTKLTIAQLKSICKAKITGYSKANKNVIIGKLLDWQKIQDAKLEGPLAPSVHIPPENSTPGLTQAAQTVPALQALDSLPKDSITTVQQKSGLPSDAAWPCNVPGGMPSVRAAVRLAEGFTVPREIALKTNNAPRENSPAPGVVKATARPPRPPNASKKGSNAVPGEGKAAKRPSDEQIDTTTLKKPRQDQAPNLTSLQKAVPAAPLNQPRALTPSGAKPPRTKLMPESKPFKALVSKRQIPFVTVVVETTRGKIPVDMPAAETAALRYLDFLQGMTIELGTISLPPSVAQRRQVPILSLVLSDISSEDLKSCARVSRLFRYAAYVSASHQLSRKFLGLRLKQLLQRYPSQMTNFWPYLRYRANEALSRRLAYERSVLCRAFNGVCSVSPLLWSSPDHERQATIAVRFLMTKLFFVVSTGYGVDRLHLVKGQVVKVQEIIPSEIWKIGFQSSNGLEEYYILEATCEVVGQPPVNQEDAVVQTRLAIRADWSAYISTWTQSGHNSIQPGPTLLQHLHWTNHEEYAKGISKLWCSRVAKEGNLGAAKLDVAERYILACVVSNSVSGKWLTSTEMAQGIGGSSPTLSMRGQRNQKLNLFLPTHHHVESVHFTTNRGQPLHPALAVVQTPAREYYILKDNGMQVGCEEEGVAWVWMDLIGCTSDGRSKPV